MKSNNTQLAVEAGKRLLHEVNQRIGAQDPRIQRLEEKTDGQQAENVQQIQALSENVAKLDTKITNTGAELTASINVQREEQKSGLETVLQKLDDMTKEDRTRQKHAKEQTYLEAAQRDNNTNNIHDHDRQGNSNRVAREATPNIGQKQAETIDPRKEPRDRRRVRREPRKEGDQEIAHRESLPMDEYLVMERPTVCWETRTYTMSRCKEIGRFKADLNKRLREEWNKLCEVDMTKADEDKVPNHIRLVAVVNRIEENKSNELTQLTCRKNEWDIVEKVLPIVITEATPVDQEVNPFLPERHSNDNEDDWHRRIIHRTIIMLRLWESAADNRPSHGTLRHHFNKMIRESKQLITGEVARHVKNIRIDRTGEKAAFVVAKEDAGRDKEGRLEALTIPLTPAANTTTPLHTPSIAGPSSAVREIAAAEENSIMRARGPEDIESNRANLAARFTKESTPVQQSRPERRQEHRSKLINKPSKGISKKINYTEAGKGTSINTNARKPPTTTAGNTIIPQQNPDNHGDSSTRPLPDTVVTYEEEEGDVEEEDYQAGEHKDLANMIGTPASQKKGQ